MTREEAQIVIGNIPINPEVLDDCYDITEYQEAKAMAIEALAQESITWIVGKDNCQVAVRNMPIDKMLKICAIIEEEEQQLCEDVISRESVIEWLKDKDIIKTKNQEENARRELDELPSVTPTRPRGKWIYKNDNKLIASDMGYWQCSNCEDGKLLYESAYCPNCGADMRESEGKI